MATGFAPGPLGGGTGDPEVDALISESGIYGQEPVDQSGFLTPEAQRWAKHWNPKPFTPMSPVFNYRRPGTPGFGILKEDAPGGKRIGSLKESPDFFVNRERGGKSGDSLRGKDTRGADRARLEAIVSEALGRPATPMEMSEYWDWALTQIEAAGMIGADTKDPWHWLEMRKAEEVASRTEEEEGPSTETTVQRSINLTDPTTAGIAVDQTLRNLLGRRASAEERAEFMAALRAEEEGNPTVTTTTAQYDGVQGRPVSEEATTTGGAPDAGTFAQQYADEEHLGEQKAVLAASYYDILRGL